MKTLLSFMTASICLVGSVCWVGSQPAIANDEAKIDARIGAWGRNCKNEIATRLGSGISMADINVTLSETTQSSIDAGEMTLKDINEYGLIYNWSVPKKKAAGSCSTDGKGNVTEFELN